MKKFVYALSPVVLLVSVAGCDGLSPLLNIINDAPTTVGVSFVNTTDFPVEFEFYTSEEGDIPRDLLTNDLIGDLTEFTVEAGQTTDLPTQPCDQIAAMTIDNADLRILGGLGPSDESSVLRESEDFACGDRVTFTFRSADIADLSIAASVAALADETP